MLFSPSECSYARSGLALGVRHDGRALLEAREICVVGGGGQSTVTSGGSEVSAGVRLEVGDMPGVVCVVQSTASLDLIPLQELLAALFSPASLPPSILQQLTIIPNRRAYVLHLDVLIRAADGGNIVDLALVAAREALSSTAVPATRLVAYEEEGGINQLVKGGKAGRDAVDYDIVDPEGEGEPLQGCDGLGVGITLNLVRVARFTIPPLTTLQIDQLPYLDATPLEQQASSSQLVVCFTAKGDLVAMRQLGEGEIEQGRLPGLLKVRPRPCERAA